jgi:hypothetical protein
VCIPATTFDLMELGLVCVRSRMWRVLKYFQGERIRQYMMSWHPRVRATSSLYMGAFGKSSADSVTIALTDLDRL